jgi:hypothetical protein
VPPPLDVAALRAQLRQRTWAADRLYAAFASMGLEYGPAHQALTAVHVGAEQLLGELRLPAVVESTLCDYVLHPSLLDSALQATIALIVDLERLPAQPCVPFALQSLRIFAACEQVMYAWARRCTASSLGESLALDVDLCDAHGRICVEMRGFSARFIGVEAPRAEAAPSDSNFYRRLVDRVLNGELSADAAAELG